MHYAGEVIKKRIRDKDHIFLRTRTDKFPISFAEDSEESIERLVGQYLEVEAVKQGEGLVLKTFTAPPPVKHVSGHDPSGKYDGREGLVRLLEKEVGNYVLVTGRKGLYSSTGCLCPAPDFEVFFSEHAAKARALAVNDTNPDCKYKAVLVTPKFIDKYRK